MIYTASLLDINKDFKMEMPKILDNAYIQSAFLKLSEFHAVEVTSINQVFDCLAQLPSADLRYTFLRSLRETSPFTVYSNGSLAISPDAASEIKQNILNQVHSKYWHHLDQLVGFSKLPGDAYSSLYQQKTAHRDCKREDLLAFNQENFNTLYSAIKNYLAGDHSLMIQLSIGHFDMKEFKNGHLEISYKNGHGYFQLNRQGINKTGLMLQWAYHVICKTHPEDYMEILRHLKYSPDGNRLLVAGVEYRNQKDKDTLKFSGEAAKYFASLLKADGSLVA